MLQVYLGDKAYIYAPEGWEEMGERLTQSYEKSSRDFPAREVVRVDFPVAFRPPKKGAVFPPRREEKGVEEVPDKEVPVTGKRRRSKR